MRETFPMSVPYTGMVTSHKEIHVPKSYVEDTVTGVCMHRGAIRSTPTNTLEILMIINPLAR